MEKIESFRSSISETNSSQLYEEQKHPEPYSDMPVKPLFEQDEQNQKFIDFNKNLRDKMMKIKKK